MSAASRIGSERGSQRHHPTLLEILSRITEPTSGRAELNGRVASLLEVGTGFHNELADRENVCPFDVAPWSTAPSCALNLRDKCVALYGLDRIPESLM